MKSKHGPQILQIDEQSIRGRLWVDRFYVLGRDGRFQNSCILISVGGIPTSLQICLWSGRGSPTANRLGNGRGGLIPVCIWPRTRIKNYQLNISTELCALSSTLLTRWPGVFSHRIGARHIQLQDVSLFERTYFDANARVSLYFQKVVSLQFCVIHI